MRDNVLQNRGAGQDLAWQISLYSSLETSADCIQHAYTDMYIEASQPLVLCFALSSYVANHSLVSMQDPGSVGWTIAIWDRASGIVRTEQVCVMQVQ
jgi:hypothetical protein